MKSKTKSKPRVGFARFLAEWKAEPNYSKKLWAVMCLWLDRELTLNSVERKALLDATEPPYRTMLRDIFRMEPLGEGAVKRLNRKLDRELGKRRKR